MTAHRTANRPCATPARVTSYTLTQQLGERLLDVALDATARVDIDDDLELMRRVTEQVTAICSDVHCQIGTYRRRSWLYRLYWLTAWLSWNSKGYRDLRALDRLIEACQMVPRGLSREFTVAQGYARDGWPGRVRDCRDTALNAVWFRVGWCLAVTS